MKKDVEKNCSYEFFGEHDFEKVSDTPTEEEREKIILEIANMIKDKK